MKTSKLHVLAISMALLLALGNQAGAENEYKTRTAEDMEILVGPIALYPDVLLAQFLPAVTYMDQCVQADKFINEQKNKPEAIDGQTWDDTVKSVAHYPELLTIISSNMDWATELGDVFIHQQKEILDAVQQMRSKAKANGALKDGAQQKVVVEQEKIIIEPANPEVVYVPQYNTETVYVESGSSSSETAAVGLLSFGVGMAMGAWIASDCNWHGGAVYSCRPYHPGAGYTRGAVVGPNGGAAWGPNGAVAWSRNGAYPRPTYNQNYRAGNNNININNSTNINTGNINRNNANNQNRNNINGQTRNPNAATRPANNNISGQTKSGASQKDPLGLGGNKAQTGAMDASSKRGTEARNSSARGAASTSQTPSAANRASSPSANTSAANRSSSSASRSSASSSSASRGTPSHSGSSSSSAFSGSGGGKSSQSSSSRGSSSRGGGGRGGRL